MNKQRRLKKSFKRLNKATKKLKKAREERIWIEQNPKINVVNYPYFKSKRVIKKLFKKD